MTEAEDLLRQNPNNLDARRVLGRIYTRLIGDAQQNKLDEKMLAKAVEQYKIIVEKAPEDQDSKLVLARLYRLSHNSVESEKAYKAVLAAEGDNEEALTGLAMVYSDVGDTKGAIEMLRRASDKDPNPRTLGALAGFYEQSNDWANAAETWKKVASAGQRQQPPEARVSAGLAVCRQSGRSSSRCTRRLPPKIRATPRYSFAWPRSTARSTILHPHEQHTKKPAKLTKTDLEVRYEEVNLLDAEGKSDAAMKVLQSILDSTAKKDYTDSDKATRTRLLDRLGILYRSAGKYPEAIAAFHQIVELDPDQATRVDELRQIVETYRVAKNLPAARQEADAALKRYPKDKGVVVVHASLLADLGKTEQGAAELRALMNGKKDREVLLMIASLYEKGHKFGEEQKTLDEAEAASTTNPDRQAVQFARGAMYEKMKNFDGAEAEFRKVLAGDPNNAGALNYLGYMLADRDVRLDEAHKLIARALEIDPNNPAYLDSLGWVLFRQNSLEQAEDYIRKALDLIGDDPTVHDHLADVYMKEGKVRDAITQWQTSLSEWEKTPPTDADPQDIAKVTKKLESARVRIAKETNK